jgi:signal peptidase II
MGIIIILDQLVKTIVVQTWPSPSYNLRNIWDVFNNGFLWILHVRNKAIAFSLGAGLPETVKTLLFIAVPLLVTVFLFWYFFRADDLTSLQRWTLAGIIGGGLGNLIDRVFRPDGVVDFISVNLYGLFGYDRWPTFNIADSAVVVCVILFLISMLVPVKKPAKETKQ